MNKFFLPSLLLPLFTFAQNQPSNEEISRKLDLILSKVASLEKRVSNLESDNKEVRQEVKVVAQSAEEAKKSIKAIPQAPEEKKSFLQNLVGRRSVKIFPRYRFVKYWALQQRLKNQSIHGSIRYIYITEIWMQTEKRRRDP